MNRPTLRLLLITPNFENNSLGRTYCLWLLARDLGYEVRIVGVKGDAVWPALAGSVFADDCVLPPSGTPAERSAALDPHVAWSDVVIAVKPLPTSFGVALAALERQPRPFVLDIDDPDLEVRTIWRPKRERLPRWLLQSSYRSTYRQLRRLRRLTGTVPVIVSNPTLQATYGGLVVPHVRIPGEPPLPSAGRAPIVRFVGSPNRHKGTDVLRQAVARLADEGFRLGITAPAPPDAHPWEEWYGFTSLEEGQRLVATADIIALPSLDRSWAKAQLPAKLMDAMVHGRVVVASDLPPIRWALDAPDLLVPPGDVDALVTALRRLADPGLRERYSRQLRARADAVFSVAAHREAFAALIDDVRATFDGPPSRPPATAPRSTGGRVPTTSSGLGATTTGTADGGSTATAPHTDGHQGGTRPQEDTVSPEREHPQSVRVALATYLRPLDLPDCLTAVLKEIDEVRRDRPGQTFDVLVVDNDPAGSASEVVAGFRERGVHYAIEPSPGISAARNRALQESASIDVLIFIDDDEEPVHGWLSAMLATWEKHGVAAVAGRVVSSFSAPLDPWVSAGRFFERLSRPTGSPIPVAATNNLLLDLNVIRALELTFDDRFGLTGGGDTHFTRSLVARGGRMVWCDEAVVIDRVPADRASRAWVLKRARRTGNTEVVVDLDLAAPGRARAVRRIVGVRRGVIRCVGGAVVYSRGRLTSSLALRARGLRTMWRGAGMLSGALGRHIGEYQRPPVASAG